VGPLASVVRAAAPLPTRSETRQHPKKFMQTTPKKYARCLSIRHAQSPYQPCIPTRATKVPASKFWIHEVKHDGYRVIVQRDGKTVRLFSRNGHDLTKRYPWIAQAALQNRQQRFVIDGEAVILGVDGMSDNALHSRKQDDQVQLYAFDILSLDGDDLRKLPLTMRKTNLARLLARRPDGIFVSEFEQGEIGPDLFRKACEFGLEGLVSKRRDSTYRAGRSPNWIKVKNRTHPAMNRVREAMVKGVLIYINTSKEVGDVDHLKVFTNEDAAEKWFAENDPEGVAFAYDVEGASDDDEMLPILNRDSETLNESSIIWSCRATQLWPSCSKSRVCFRTTD
jgi:bifunctional non-homologous end joining protein LigD